jgi:glutamine---fructose-6-phosphate transaminase (isomerizing)
MEVRNPFFAIFEDFPINFFTPINRMIEFGLYDRSWSCCSREKRPRNLMNMPTFDHEMLREIYEQPEALRHTLGLYLENNSLKPQVAAMLASWAIPEGEILIAASGSSRHSGLAAEILLEDLCGLAVDVEYASEYSCRGANTKADLRHPSVLVLSQSGETSDTLAALHEAQLRGQKTLAITNAASSTMALEADVSMPLAAGVEKAIPATKSFTCQLAVLYLLALYEGVRLGRIDGGELGKHIRELQAVPDHIEAQLDGWRAQMAALAQKYKPANTFLFLGRGIHYAIAREGALKLKEASYVHAEGYPTGELKHGPNALVSDTVPLVVLATVDRELDASVFRYEKTLQLLRDMKAQGAKVIAVANRDDEEVKSLVSDCVYVDPAPEYLLPIEEVVPLQLFSYFMALEYGVNVDRPRNLSKAVVESNGGE